MLQELQASSFEEHLGTKFRISLGEGGVLELELVQVALYERHPGPRQQPFSLLFRAPAGRGNLPQAIYRLEHDLMGPLEIFLVPIGPDAQGMRYEAVFN